MNGFICSIRRSFLLFFLAAGLSAHRCHVHLVHRSVFGSSFLGLVASLNVANYIPLFINQSYEDFPF